MKICKLFNAELDESAINCNQCGSVEIKAGCPTIIIYIFFGIVVLGIIGFFLLVQVVKRTPFPR